jgi:hypothetical protein
MLFFSRYSGKMVQEIEHNNEIGGPLLSNYTINDHSAITHLEMHYALYCFLNEPYEPAGLKLHEFPLTEQPFVAFNINNRLSVNSNAPLKGFSHIQPYFSFQLKEELLQPVYTGFSFLNANLKLKSGSCVMNQITTQVPCGLEAVTEELHKALSKIQVDIQKVILGKNGANRYFKPQLLVEIIGNLESEEVKKEEISVEQPTNLVFIVKNNTHKIIYLRHNGHSGKYDVQLNANEVAIKKNQQIELARLVFSMDNPKNYSAKIVSAEFPELLFSKIIILYGKKKLPLQLDLKWTYLQNELTITYTLEINL